VVIAAALLHDTIEDTETTYDELRGAFGAEVADVVVEVTDVKFLAKESRKRLQVSKAGRASDRARLVKLADKIAGTRATRIVSKAALRPGTGTTLSLNSIRRRTSKS
jgi:guanosine-3',5'-bis(diphosphate) 3'-pyrophosphohydrolase